jgi:membrane protease YdiL (CAAX protease family)
VTARERPWSVWLAIPIALTALVAGVLAFAIAGAIRDALVTLPQHAQGLTGVAADGTPPAETITSTVVQDVVLAAGVLVAAWIATGRRRARGALGLGSARVGSSVAYVVVGYVLFLVISGLWTSLLGVTGRDNVAVELGSRDSAGALIAAGLLVGAVAPVAEELFFRGFVFGALRRHGFWPAAVVSGLLFGGAHVASSPIGFLLPLAALGVILCAVYERTGSLLPGIGLHCLNNSVALGAGDGREWVVPACLLVSGVAIALFVRGLRRVVPAG